MQERRNIIKDQQKRILTKSNLIGILFFILLLITFSAYLIQNKLIIPIPSMLISHNYSTLITTKTELLKRNFYSKSNIIRCVVYVKSSGGRLGNRMFIIASAYGLARLHSCHLYLTNEILNEIQQTFIPDFSSILISPTTFDLILNKSNPLSRITKYVGCEYILELTRPNAISNEQLFELTGYWQSYLYFLKYAIELRQFIFIAKSAILEKISHFFLDIYQKKFHIKPQFLFRHHHIFKQQLINLNEIVWIGIHIRRSDFIHLRYSSSDEYLFTAIQYYTERYSNAYFIVASDDKAHSQKLFKNRSNIFITPTTFSAGEDLITLSLCEHSIITGGTFGWWTGFLANGQVIHDKVYAGCEKREHYHPPWFFIDVHVHAHKNNSHTL